MAVLCESDCTRIWVYDVIEITNNLSGYQSPSPPIDNGLMQYHSHALIVSPFLDLRSLSLHMACVAEATPNSCEWTLFIDLAKWSEIILNFAQRRQVLQSKRANWCANNKIALIIKKTIILYSG